MSRERDPPSACGTEGFRLWKSQAKTGINNEQTRRY